MFISAWAKLDFRDGLPWPGKDKIYGHYLAGIGLSCKYSPLVWDVHTVSIHRHVYWESAAAAVGHANAS